MNCVICKHGETQPGKTSVTLERGNAVMVFRDVPAEICSTCGEAYHSDDVTSELLRQAEEAFSEGVEMDVRRFGTAA